VNTALIIVSIIVVIIGVIGVTIWQKRKAKQDALNRPIENFTSVTIDWSPREAADPNSVNDFSIITPNLGIILMSHCDLPLLYQLCAEQAWQKVRDNVPADWAGDAHGQMMFIIPPDHTSVVDYGEGLGSPLLNIRQNLGTQDHPNISLVSSAGTTIGLAKPGTSPMTGDVIGGYAMPLAPVVAVDEKDLKYPRFFRNSLRNELEHRFELGNNAQIAQEHLFADDHHPRYGPDMWNDPLPEVPTV